MNGKSHPAEKYKITAVPEKGLNYEDAYIWHMTMAPKEIVKVHHHYVTGVTINVVGQNFVSFVLKTGALWKRKIIEHARFEVIPNTATRMCSELDKSADYLQAKPPGVKAIGTAKERKYVWDLKNFQPKEDLELCLITGKNYVRYFIVKPIVQGAGYNKFDLNKMPKSQLPILRNSIYAQYGRRFEDQKLQTYFNKQWWYEPNSNYTESLLTDEDKQAIAIIAKLEAH